MRAQFKKEFYLALRSCRCRKCVTTKTKRLAAPQEGVRRRERPNGSTLTVRVSKVTARRSLCSTFLHSSTQLSIALSIPCEKKKRVCCWLIRVGLSGECEGVSARRRVVESDSRIGFVYSLSREQKVA